jgi:hypothetical protein
MVASMLPEELNKKLIDLNILELEEKDLEWADYVFLSAINFVLSYPSKEFALT